MIVELYLSHEKPDEIVVEILGKKVQKREGKRGREELNAAVGIHFFKLPPLIAVISLDFAFACKSSIDRRL